MRDRLTLKDSPVGAVIKLSEGNPGAVTVCMKILSEAEKIDPQAVLGGWAVLFQLDVERIYGSRIWMLYKDVCKQNMVYTLAILRALQLGIITSSQLNTAIDGRGEGLDIEECLFQVKLQLAEFDKNEKEN